jgi:hypothetical protein
MTSSSRYRACIRVALALLTLAATVALMPAAAQAQATRTWVSGVGDDVNPCSRTAPCKTFAGAISKTAASGEINALDPGGFGAVTITKAITIDGGPFTAGVLTNAANGINVSAGVGDEVVLRDLDIDGLCTATAGIRFNSGKRLLVENTTIRAFSAWAINMTPSTANATVVIDDVETSQCGDGIIGGGLNAEPSAPAVDVLVRDSRISGTTTAVRAASGAHVRLTGTTIFGNDFGLVTVGTGVIDSCGDNQVFGNGTAAAPTNGIANAVNCNPAAPAPPVVQAPVAVPPPAVVPPPPPAAITAPKVAVVVCTVPNVVGLTLAKAKTKLTKAHCALGKVTKKTTKKSSRVGKVSAQSSKAGTTRSNGAKVNVTVGKRAKKA